MKKLSKGARKHLLSHLLKVAKKTARWNANMAVHLPKIVTGYIGNHRKHNRAPVAVEHTKGKYLTARERNRM